MTITILTGCCLSPAGDASDRPSTPASRAPPYWVFATTAITGRLGLEQRRKSSGRRWCLIREGLGACCGTRYLWLNLGDYAGSGRVATPTRESSTLQGGLGSQERRWSRTRRPYPNRWDARDAAYCFCAKDYSGPANALVYIKPRGSWRDFAVPGCRLPPAIRKILMACPGASPSPCSGRLVSPTATYLWRSRTRCRIASLQRHQEPRYLFLFEPKRAVLFNHEARLEPVSRIPDARYRQMSGPDRVERRARGVEVVRAGETNGTGKRQAGNGSTLWGVWLGRKA